RCRNKQFHKSSLSTTSPPSLPLLKSFPSAAPSSSNVSAASICLSIASARPVFPICVIRRSTEIS
ncbi:MAG: hypothetical protein Q9223_004764, partial [Gallowayella weberi]